MALKIVIFACVVAVARGGVVAPVVAAPAVAARLEEFDPRPQYSFGYDVSDAVSGDYKSQQEVRDGDVVQGSYSLVDPDGTRRIVDYAADPVNGFNAVVRREPLVVAAPEVVEPAIVSARYVAPAVGAPVVAAKISAPVAAPVVAARYAAPVAAAPFVNARYTAPVAAAPLYNARYTAPVATAPLYNARYTAPVAATPVVSAPLAAPAYAKYAYEPVAYTAPVARYSAVAYTAPVARYSTAYTAPTGAVARLTLAPAAVAV